MEATTAVNGSRKLVIGASFVATAASATALLAIPAATRSAFSMKFLPHAYCYFYDKKLIGLHLGSDALIWLSYVAISCTLVYLVWRTRREVPFSWMLLAFGTFIVACGFTHFMEMVVLWKPMYWLAGDVKLLTALASVVTAIALPGLVPEIHAMVTAARLSAERKEQLERAYEEMQKLSSRVVGAQDAERRRIARELHDGVGQYLMAIKMASEMAIAQSAEAAPTQKALQDSITLIDRCTAEVRTMSHLLHPPLLEEMGLAAAVPWLVEGFQERSGIKVELDMPEDLGRLSQPVELALFRVLQEGLTNIHRHANSPVAAIRLRREKDAVVLEIQDRGYGFAQKQGEVKKAGVGIAGMRERVSELGGEFQMISGKEGTTVRVSIPAPRNET